MNWRSVRGRLMLWNMAVVAVVMAAFAAALVTIVLTSRMRDIDADLYTRGTRTAMAWPRGGPPRPPPRPALRGTRRGPGDRDRLRGYLAPGYPEGESWPREPQQFGPGERAVGPSPRGGGDTTATSRESELGAPTHFPPAYQPLRGYPVPGTRPEPPPPAPAWEPRRAPGGAPEGPSDLRRPRIFDRNGQPFGPDTESAWDERALASAAEGVPGFSDVTVDNEPLRVYSVPMRAEGQPAGPIIGVVQVAHPMGELAEFRAGLIRMFLLLLPGGLLVAALGGLFLTGRALRPVRQLSQEAAGIGADDLSRRLPVTAEDEIGELATTFNGMLGRLEDAFRRLRESYEHQRRFTRDASHELRTPLTALKVNTSLALLGERDASEYREALEHADQAADVMTRIIQDMLLLARSDAGRLTVERTPVPLQEVLEQAAELALPSRGVQGSGTTPEVKKQRSKEAEKGAGQVQNSVLLDFSTSRLLDFDLQPSTLRVLGDAHHLTRLFSNLLTNAARHTPPEGEIRVDARMEGEFVLVTVADTGEGIPQEHLDHVCQPFYRVDSARSRGDGGSGLGLAICQGIVRAHGGRMRIESEQSKGTTVSIWLPAATEGVEG